MRPGEPVTDQPAGTRTRMSACSSRHRMCRRRTPAPAHAPEGQDVRRAGRLGCPSLWLLSLGQARESSSAAARRSKPRDSAAIGRTKPRSHSDYARIRQVRSGPSSALRAPSPRTRGEAEEADSEHGLAALFSPHAGRSLSDDLEVDPKSPLPPHAGRRVRDSAQIQCHRLRQTSGTNVELIALEYQNHKAKITPIQHRRTRGRHRCAR